MARSRTSADDKLSHKKGQKPPWELSCQKLGANWSGNNWKKKGTGTPYQYRIDTGAGSRYLAELQAAVPGRCGCKLQHGQQKAAGLVPEAAVLAQEQIHAKWSQWQWQLESSAKHQRDTTPEQLFNRGHEEDTTNFQRKAAIFIQVCLPVARQDWTPWSEEAPPFPCSHLKQNQTTNKKTSQTWNTWRKVLSSYVFYT